MTTSKTSIKPFLKWAGGKQQLIPELLKYIPPTYGKYIEPFIGGGALFFNLLPKKAILSDSNPELIITYKVIRDNEVALIKSLRKYKNDESLYYETRAINPITLDDVERAARLIFLNKTCFNGLYRVNKQGQFNVPFGNRINPTILDENHIKQTSKALQGIKILLGDYSEVLSKYPRENDLIFLDPPYHPVSVYADFKRYTKDFFGQEDQIELRDKFIQLVNMGCQVILTNSNTDYIKMLYEGFHSEIIETRRNISSKAETRKGQDLIIIGKRIKSVSIVKKSKPKLLENFPGTRYMGSKYRLLPFIWEHTKNLNFDSVTDAFAGSTCVSYMYKEYGKRVVSNDFMSMSFQFAKAIIENSDVILSKDDTMRLLDYNSNSASSSRYISNNFRGLYFTDEENLFLDVVRNNINQFRNPYKKALSLAALIRACIKRRPRGVFTFVGNRYDDGRRDMQLDLKAHFLENIEAFNKAVFNNKKKNQATNLGVYDIEEHTDLVYLDPPYLTPHSDNDYTRRYHFVEGLAKNWQGLELQQHTETKKFKKYDSPFYNKSTVFDGFEKLFKKFENSIIVLSYSSNSIPSKKELVSMLQDIKKNKVIVKEFDLTYSFGNQGEKVGNNANRVKEYLFIAK